MVRVLRVKMVSYVVRTGYISETIEDRHIHCVQKKTPTFVFFGITLRKSNRFE